MQEIQLSAPHETINDTSEIPRAARELGLSKEGLEALRKLENNPNLSWDQYINIMHISRHLDGIKECVFYEDISSLK